ncbi:hypothetical protein N9934_01115 [Desulfosarcina sp.]|nr:hypothetical protein [Desulfosarcina sp.]
MASKKGIGWDIVVLGILMPILGLVAFSGIFFTASENAEVTSSLESCRFGVLLSDRAGPVSGALDALNFCRNHRVSMPEELLSFERTEKDAMENIGMRVVDCWYQYNQGLGTGKVFASGNLKDKQCATCFTFDIDNIKGDTKKLSFEEVFESLQHGPISAKSKSPLICEDLSEQGIMVTECITRNDYDLLETCEKNGGQCLDACTRGENQEYSKWGCDKKSKCCVDTDKFITTLSYVYLENGRGAVLFEEYIKDNGFEKGEEYTISFMSGERSLDIGTLLGVAGGGAAITLGSVLLVSGPPGWIVGGIAIGTGASIAYFTEQAVEDSLKENDKIIVSRAVSAEDYCVLNAGADGKK